MKLGVCYYPEHWPEQRWPVDARLMRQAGLSLVRIADFAWVAIEPDEGEFSWDWLDRAIGVLAAEGLQIVLCTPTASPPPWLCRAYPDILPVDVQGRRRRFSSRRHYCPNNPTYHKHTERIVSAMTSRYGGHPAVVAWQVDNEFGCHDTARCYCEACAASFRSWLEAKYGTIAALNQAWGTIFWSQTYGDWSEIDPPNLTIAGPNPSHLLDYYRFSSDSYVNYQGLQITILRSSISDNQLITTNFMSQYTDLDYYDLASALDFVSVSSYPTGHAESRSGTYMPSSVQPNLPYDVGDPYIYSLVYTLMRGFKQKRPFWIMEQQCGNVNWGEYNTGIRPGTVRLWTWHALASGAEAVLYFRWRAGLFAQEQLHSGLLNHDASPAVGFADLQAMKADRSLMSEVAREPHKAEIGFLLDFDSIWGLRFQPHHRYFGFMRHLFVFYRALQRLGIPADVLSTGTDLSAYKLVILPSAFVATEQLASTLKDFTRAGGMVLFGVRSGFKTTDNRVIDLPLPGYFRDLVCATVTDWHSLPPGTSYDLKTTFPGIVGPATVWAEALHPVSSEAQVLDPNLQILAHYTSGPFKSRAALVEHKVGAGRALYLGWFPSDQQAEMLLAHLASQAGIKSLAALPEGLIAIQRGKYIVLLNFTDEPLQATVNERPLIVGPRDLEVLNLQES
jgi:beta-galactosidase